MELFLPLLSLLKNELKFLESNSLSTSNFKFYLYDFRKGSQEIFIKFNWSLKVSRGFNSEVELVSKMKIQCIIKCK